MKRFFSGLGRFFWSWGFLKFILWTVTLIILFYVEEDWRGARAWAATKAEWEAKGISFDPQTYFPPSIPDAQNLVAIPLFKLEPDPGDKNDRPFPLPLALRKAMRRNLPGEDLPSIGSRQFGQLPDMGKIRVGIATAYAEAFKTSPPSNNPLAQFETLYPFLAELRSAAALRPSCRFQADYIGQPPVGRPVGLLTDQIRLSQILTIHAILAFDDHQSNLALEDIKTNFKLISGVQRDPSLIAGLIGIGMTAIGKTAINEGIALHAWNDAQLAEIQDELSR
ncbi:MAG TPA: hypothetical protein VGC39_01505, partial [Candidatus Methylacidiphilales bacterium]